MARLIRLGLMAWGLISLGAVTGIGVFYWNTADDAPLVASAAPPVAVEPMPAHEPSAISDSARERLAVLMESPSPLLTAPSPELAAALTLRAPTPTAASRMPRPRPEAEEPIITGSIGAPADEPAYVPQRRRSMLDPCRALIKLGAPYLFGNRCGHYTRAYPPPGRFAPPSPPPQGQAAAPPPPQALQAAAPQPDHAPRPYQPPVIQN